MPEVVLREITRENFSECASLTVEPWQVELVATNLKSLAEAKIDSALFPFAIYDRAAVGSPLDRHRMLGFTMLEIRRGVGFIVRLMIDKEHQRKGYGRAAMVEVIRQLRLHPEVRLIATSHRRKNEAASKLCRELGFRDWGVPWENPDPDEIYLALQDQ